MVLNAPAHQARGWSIAEVERETGLAKDTLRIWERRYGFPTPERDTQGERRYDDAQVQRLRWLKHLLDQGHRPGQVVALPLRQVRAMAEAQSEAQRPGAGAGRPALLDPRWMQSLLAHDLDALRRALHLHTLQHGLLTTVEEVIAPLAAAVGQAWASGTLSVYQEHLFTEAVDTALREAMAGLANSQASLTAPRVLLTTLPGESHTLGLLMAESVLALQGCERLPLGASTPLSEIVLAAERLRADVVAIGVSARATPLSLRRDLQLLRERLPGDVSLWVGGPVRSALGRRALPGITLVPRASELVSLVAAWREQHRRQ